MYNATAKSIHLFGSGGEAWPYRGERCKLEPSRLASHQTVLGSRLLPAQMVQSNSTQYESLPVRKKSCAVEPDKVKLGEPSLIPDEWGVDVVDRADKVDLGVAC